MIDRAIVLIKKKNPYLEWVRNLPDPDLEIGLEELNQDPSSYLIPSSEEDDELLEHLKSVSSEIFKIEMNSWWTVESDWEKDLSWKNFKKWFDFEISSMPLDLGEDEIYREKFY
jgi:hypothetical protein